MIWEFRRLKLTAPLLVLSYGDKSNDAELSVDN